ncbi:hypothetical protein BTVI_150028 [Pitangus sulphuratus]|nr:hypothetical protein BTVI_150028 [Pitangus sulphuratus]
MAHLRLRINGSSASRDISGPPGQPLGEAEADADLALSEDFDLKAHILIHDSVMQEAVKAGMWHRIVSKSKQLMQEQPVATMQCLWFVAAQPVLCTPGR